MWSDWLLGLLLYRRPSVTCELSSKRLCTDSHESLNWRRGETHRARLWSRLLLFKWKNAKASVHVPSRCHVPIVPLGGARSPLLQIWHHGQSVSAGCHMTHTPPMVRADLGAIGWVVWEFSESAAHTVHNIITTESTVGSTFWFVFRIHIQNIWCVC